eukprot:CAMPEP_0179006702 /NCGR_PEP_ID=MMETSP0795-20121207/14712_1 /TAXON_ID=88552 /ORGANISM="Amoebophrya sp., Strain Ameob2" /LENGTH=1068 /DNA_ID=CAMNT_0020701515 /DNA_START=614 /DNA_END=3821 /DNA_ORIENTATION=+
MVSPTRRTARRPARGSRATRFLQAGSAAAGTCHLHVLLVQHTQTHHAAALIDSLFTVRKRNVGPNAGFMAAEVRENSEIVGNGKEGQAGDLEEQKHNANQKRQSSRSSAAEYSDDQSSAAKMAAAAQKTSGAAKNFEAPPVSAALELEQHKASWFTNLASGAGSHITKLYEQRAPTALQTAVASGTSAITKRWPFWRGGQSAGVDVEHEGLTENEDKGELQPKPAELKGNGGGEHSRTETAQDVDGVGEPRVQTGAGSAVSAEAQHDQERATLQDAIGGAAAEAGAGGIVGRTQKLKEQATALAESLMKGLYSAPGEAEETSGTTQSDVTGDHVGLVHNGALEEQTEIGRAADVAIADNLKEVAGAQNSVANAAANAAAMTDQKLTKMKQELKRTRHNVDELSNTVQKSNKRLGGLFQQLLPRVSGVEAEDVKSLFSTAVSSAPGMKHGRPDSLAPTDEQTSSTLVGKVKGALTRRASDMASAFSGRSAGANANAAQEAEGEEAADGGPDPKSEGARAWDTIVHGASSILPTAVTDRFIGRSAGANAAPEAEGQEEAGDGDPVPESKGGMWNTITNRASSILQPAATAVTRKITDHFNGPSPSTRTDAVTKETTDETDGDGDGARGADGLHEKTKSTTGATGAATGEAGVAFSAASTARDASDSQRIMDDGSGLPGARAVAGDAEGSDVDFHEQKEQGPFNEQKEQSPMDSYDDERMTGSEKEEEVAQQAGQPGRDAQQDGLQEEDRREEQRVENAAPVLDGTDDDEHERLRSRGVGDGGEAEQPEPQTPARSTEAFQFAIKPNKQAEYCALPAPECNDGGSAIFPHKSIAESSANVLVADVDVFGVNSQDVKLEDKVQLCRLQCLMNSGCVHWSLTKQQGFSSWSCTLFKHGTGTTLEYSCVQAEQYPNSALSGLPTAFAGCVPSQMKGSWLARDSHFSSSGLLRVGELQTKMNALLDEYVSEGQEVAVQKDKIATAIEYFLKRLSGAMEDGHVLAITGGPDKMLSAMTQISEKLQQALVDGSEVELPQVKELVEQMNKHITLLANNLDPIARRARAATAAPAQTVA